MMAPAGRLYVANLGWPVPGGRPDMGGVSADGKVLCHAACQRRRPARLTAMPTTAATAAPTAT